MKTCPNCHRENSDESIFCEYCGTQLMATESAMQFKNTTANGKVTEAFKIPFIIALIALFISLVWGGITYDNYKNWREYAEQLEVRGNH